VVRQFKKFDIEAVKYTRPPNWQPPPPETKISLHKRIRKKASVHQLFPDVLPSNEMFIPLFPLKITYPSGVSVGKGSHIDSVLVQDIPKVEFEKRKGSKFWTLLMTSPDDPLGDKVPPSRGGARGTEFLHWLVVNIPENDMNLGETVCTYFPATPSQGREEGHRYVFLLFEQKEGKMEFSKSLAIDNEKERYYFNTKRLKDEYNLVPTSMAFFKSGGAGKHLKRNYEKLGISSALPFRPIQPSPYLDVSRW